MAIGFRRFPGEIVLQKGHIVTAPVRSDSKFCVLSPAAAEAQVAPTRQCVTVSLWVWVFFPRIVVLISLEATNVPCGFLIEVVALQRAAQPPVLPAMINSYCGFLLIVS